MRSTAFLQTRHWERPAANVWMKPQADAGLRRTAWTVLGHSQFEEQRYAEAEHSYQQTLSLMSKNDGERRGIEENLAAAVYKQGELARSSGDLHGAARHFLRIADMTPSAGIAATAQFDAAAAFLIFAGINWLDFSTRHYALVCLVDIPDHIPHIATVPRLLGSRPHPRLFPSGA